MRRELRPHQTRAIDLLRRSLGSGKRRPLLQAPTGFGKTMLGAAIVEGALAKGNRVIFTVPALSLVDQTVMALWNEGIHDVGVIQGAHELTNASRPVQVASVQTLARREIPAADVVVIDEAHRVFDLYGRWMSATGWERVPFIGLSATPWTRGLGKLFDDLLIAATTGDLIEAGYLSRFRVFAPSHPDLTGVRTVAGDYHEGDLGEAMNKTALVADVVETWLAKGEGRPTLCFAVDRAHARHIQTRFAEEGVSTAYVDAYTSTGEREAIRKRFHSGEVKVVCNVGCLTTGVDWDVRCIILARPTRSEMLYVQIIGRGLRTADGKDDCLILDHSDTTLKLGFVTDIHHDRLDDGKARKSAATERKEPLPKECPQCSFLKPPKVAKCPCCGFAPQRQSQIECEDGDLVELTPKGKEASREVKQRWYSMLMKIADERGYSGGWVAHKFRDKFKVWPRGLHFMRMEPDEEVRNYVKAGMIRWAKRQKKVAEAANVAA
jgi:DNA or RNA helicases of superfamily II